MEIVENRVVGIVGEVPQLKAEPVEAVPEKETEVKKPKSGRPKKA